jgi:hypothetical protein
MVLALDDAVPEDVAARIRAEPAVLDLWVIRLPIGSGRDT